MLNEEIPYYEIDSTKSLLRYWNEKSKERRMRVSQYNKEELSLVIQALFPLGLIGGLAIFLNTNFGGFPWYMLLGAAIGLSIIILTLVGKKASVVVASLLVGAAILTPIYNLINTF